MMGWVGKASVGIGELGQAPLKEMVVENKNGHSWGGGRGAVWLDLSRGGKLGWEVYCDVYTDVLGTKKYM